MTDCVHKWALEPEAVSNVYGSCLKCGEDRIFLGARQQDAMAFRSIITSGMLSGVAKKKARVGIHLPGSPDVKEGDVEWA